MQRGGKQRGQRGGMKSARKASSPVDWIMSLGIFLIYIAWFFIYVRPLVSPPVEMGSLLEVMGGSFEANTTWSVDTVPLVVFSNISGIEEPVIADFEPGWNETGFAFSDNRTFFFDSRKIFFLNNITPGKSVFELAHSGESYSQPTAAQRDLAAAKDSVSVGRASMKADFVNSVLASAVYRDSYRIQGFNLTINSVALVIENSSFTSTPIVAKYGIQTQLLNHSSYVFAENPGIYSFVWLNKPFEQQQNFSISAVISNSTTYYADTGSGAISFNGSCKDLLTGYLDLSDGIAGFTFIFRENANISLCTKNSTLKVTASFILKNETRYDIIMHQGSYNSTLKYKSPYTARLGAIDRQSGISSRLLASLNSTNYSAVKANWGFPPSRELAFTVVNESNSEIYRYEPVAADRFANIFVREIKSHLLDQYGRRQRVTVRLKAW
ncbi:hypothetical protein HYV82_02375 [Candidatus Woesearchaeota archaeon]|nr:hypothetical protein [Candidatus Woesearchaeota archaeon]